MQSIAADSPVDHALAEGFPLELSDVHRPGFEFVPTIDLLRPWNGKAPYATDPAVLPRFAGGILDAREVLQWTDGDYQSRLRGSAMKRVKLPQLKRNARVVLDNS